jgi:hypothetical protein
MEHVNINNANECYKDADAFYGDTIDCLRMLTAGQRMLMWVADKFRKIKMSWGRRVTEKALAQAATLTTIWLWSSYSV